MKNAEKSKRLRRIRISSFCILPSTFLSPSAFFLSPTLLAQFPSASGNEMVTWLLCAAAAVLIIERSVSFYRTVIRELPEPASTYQLKGDLATRAELREMKTDLMGRIGEVKTEQSAMRIDRQSEKTSHALTEARSYEKIHQRIDQVLAAVSELKGEIKGRESRQP